MLKKMKWTPPRALPKGPTKHGFEFLNVGEVLIVPSAEIKVKTTKKGNNIDYHPAIGNARSWFKKRKMTVKTYKQDNGDIYIRREK